MATGVAELPDDALADVFNALPARSLALARCVCKAWRDTVDTRALLLPHLLPHSVRGVFIEYIDHYRPHHFTRPCPSSMIPRVDGMLGFLPKEFTGSWSVRDHCNGLLLYNISRGRYLCVCNPAASRWTVLPPLVDIGSYHLYDRAYITFDPAESPHFQVIVFPAARAPRVAFHDEEFDARRLTEWPPTTWTLHVFSSRSGHWEERAFVREGIPAGTVEEMLSDPNETLFYGPHRRYAVYHRGSLYVHCLGYFVTRFSLSNGEYKRIETPTKDRYGKPYLGKLNKDVCFGIVDNEHLQLKIWILNESSGQMEWVLKYEVEVGICSRYARSITYDNDGSWIVEEENNSDIQMSYEWDSENDDTCTVDNLKLKAKKTVPGLLTLLGFIL